MIKENFFKTQQIKSIILLFIASLLLALLICWHKYLHSSYSTGFISAPNYLFLKNTIISYIYQQIGISIYILPIILIIWSYRLFFNKKINFILLRMILLLIIMLISPVLLSNSYFNSQSILGVYLEEYFNNLYHYTILITISVIVLLLFISSITITEIIISLSLICFIAFSCSRLIYLFIKDPLNKLFLYFICTLNKIKKETIIQKDKTSKLADAFASLDKEVWNTNLANSTKDQNINETKSSIKSNNFIHELSSMKETFIFPNTHTKTEHYTSPENHKEKIDNSDLSLNLNKNDKQYSLPSEILDVKDERNNVNLQEIKLLAKKLEQVIKEFGIDGKIVNVQTGPVVTLFEITIPPGVKTNKLVSLETDIALRMRAFSVRIAVVPGKDVIGIEIPNPKRKTVYLRKLLENKTFTKSDAKLPLALGLDISGKPVVADLASMPHLLVAGTTGSGKSVAVNAMILSLLYKYSPEQCKMIMIDPKMLELSIYQGIPHLLTPVVTDPKKAIYALKWAVMQMEHRYTLMSYLGVRNISGYNQKIENTKEIAEIKNFLLEKEGHEIEFPFMPYIIVIIDEMADLMLVAGKEIEAAVQRLAQMARAAGIHLIMATQRPSVDVITGTIKANFPTRVSFQVSSRIDSNTILGDKGAEQLLGKGDMLYMMGVGRLLRVHAPFVSDKEVDKVVNILKNLGAPEYIDEVTKDKDSLGSNSTDNDLDELYNDVINLIKQEQKISTSYIQRKFQIGYNRAARIVESLEENGVVSKPTATGKREILI